MELTLPQARQLQLAAQGLLQPASKPATRAGLRASVACMGLLQIDTIHVVARSPYLVLFSRLGAYPQHWLDEALAQGALFETWAHEACFAPAEDLLAHRLYNREARKHWGLVNAQKSHVKQRAELDKLLALIRDNGPVKSSDFERPEGIPSAWWGWKDEKRWLEALFASGELMVARREKFQRVYDLAERVAPQLNVLAGNQDPIVDPLTPSVRLASAERSVRAPTLAEVRAQFTEKSVAALGLTQARWVHDYYRSKPRLKDTDLDVLVEQGRMLRVAVEGWSVPAYVHSNQSALLKKALAGKLEATHTALLSPFDPIVWDRERALTLFGFDYRLECYTPEAKRIHGYFVLPILCRGELIGRLDAKAHRAEGVFEVKALHAQAGCAWTDAQTIDVAAAIQRCANWHATPQVKISHTRPGKLGAALRRALRDNLTESSSQ
ncbi:hypothetical protein DIC66_06350 [Rhodoferax lacus]|uniref:Winged helix-turn-helix domain-containing protein n=1 Tax=Rhodoferax lacus TaxID=2184758 RepID=A0A3E1RFV1_9BURK|nr:crosslink repair DNA glycosylase YcaQ family protein [Rhodoferax lacus]RFO97490.1 hypothetical protein DIC66_06350 [Rhodoferax lacus]